MFQSLLARLCCAPMLALLLMGASPAEAKRVALVIGNDDYENVANLQKAVNDARAVGDTLKDLGYELIAAENVPRREMNRKLQEFAAKIARGDEALFFFAGHGVEISGQNFLLPTDIPDAKPGQEGFVKVEAVGVHQVLDIIRGRGGRVAILVLDACRNNPFRREGTRSLGGTRGLARMAAPEGTFIMYSAGVGQEAMDTLGDDDLHPNSIFTRTLIPLLKTPGLKLTETARQVRRQVQKLAATVPHEQRPAYYDEVTGEFYFTPGGAEATAPSVSSGASQDETLWATIKDSDKASDFKFYLSEHPTGRYSSVAKLKIKQLKEEKVAVGVFPEKPKEGAFEPGDTFRDCSDCPEMVVVPAGEFMMGSPVGEKDRKDDQGPQRQVTIANAFAVAKFEVTRDQFEAFVKATRQRVKNSCSDPASRLMRGKSFRDPGFFQEGNHPVVCVSWNEAKAYVAWLSNSTGKSYRLLTEAEWEYAARAVTTTTAPSTRWSFGDDEADLCEYANHADQSTKMSWRNRSCNDGIGAKTAAAGSFKANGFGLHDMHGNVYELVEDCRHNYGGAPTDGSAVTTGVGCTYRVPRGGSWNSGPGYLSSSTRAGAAPDSQNNETGFRVARTLIP